MAAITGLLIGATPEAVGLLGAAAASLITPGLSGLLARALEPGFPLLQFPFIVATLAMMMVIRWSRHSLLPVALHAVYFPEEHRRRYAVSRSLLGNFRHRLRALVGAGILSFPRPSPSAPVMPGSWRPPASCGSSIASSIATATAA